MTTTAANSTSTASNRTTSVVTDRLTHAPVWAVSAAAAVVGAVALYAYGAAAQAVGVPMHAADPGASKAVAISPASFSFGVVFCMLLGTGLAVATARWAKRPDRTFLRTALALVAVSLLLPLAASHTAESTRITLAVAHLLAAAIIIPPIVVRLSAVRRRARS